MITFLYRVGPSSATKTGHKTVMANFHFLRASITSWTAHDPVSGLLAFLPLSVFDRNELLQNSNTEQYPC